MFSRRLTKRLLIMAGIGLTALMALIIYLDRQHRRTRQEIEDVMPVTAIEARYALLFSFVQSQLDRTVGPEHTPGISTRAIRFDSEQLDVAFRLSDLTLLEVKGDHFSWGSHYPGVQIDLARSGQFISTSDRLDLVTCRFEAADGPRALSYGLCDKLIKKGREELPGDELYVRYSRPIVDSRRDSFIVTIVFPLHPMQESMVECNRVLSGDCD